MNPQEILPSPEKDNDSENIESNDGVNESAGAKQVELKPSASPQGSTAISGVAVDDAHTVVRGAQTDDNSSLGAVAGSSVQIDIPEDAKDLDLIEKEWVDKAKKIVDETIGDPYNQNKKINQMKTEYIRKRYNKEIKQEEKN